MLIVYIRRIYRHTRASLGISQLVEKQQDRIFSSKIAARWRYMSNCVDSSRALRAKKRASSRQRHMPTPNHDTSVHELSLITSSLYSAQPYGRNVNSRSMSPYMTVRVCRAVTSLVRGVGRKKEFAKKFLFSLSKKKKRSSDPASIGASSLRSSASLSLRGRHSSCYKANELAGAAELGSHQRPKTSKAATSS